ncbi:MAG: hypothetical protein ACFFHV_17000 [Promethearchaeota archaeon]
MSLETIKEKSNNLSENSDGIIFESKNIFIRVVPFSKLMQSRNRMDIYTGEERIPFEKRDPLYKSILRKEFSNAIKEFSKTISNLM